MAAGADTMAHVYSQVSETQPGAGCMPTAGLAGSEHAHSPVYHKKTGNTLHARITVGFAKADC